MTRHPFPELWRTAWTTLESAANTGDGAFHTPTIATVDRKGQPRSRVIVLRSATVDDYHLSFYTDVRSVKVRHILNGSETSWTFWDPEQQLQFLGGGPTLMVDATTEEGVFSELPKHARKAYATTQPPGTVLSAAGSGLPANWEALDVQETDFALANFSIFTTRLRWAEVLHLDRKGNTRLAAERGEDGKWRFDYLVP